MTHEELTRILSGVRGIRAGVAGDFCLDAYLLIDSRDAEPSLETGLPTRPVRAQRYAPGGAGNVACNLRAMGAGNVALFGVVGADPFGAELTAGLRERGMDTAGLLTQREGWDTHVYMKPFEKEQEQHRIDFGGFNVLHPAEAHRLLEEIARAMETLDLLIVKQQIARGVCTPEIRDGLRRLAADHPRTVVIADSRHYADDFGSARRRLPLREALRLTGEAPPGESIPGPAALEGACRELYRRWQAPLFVTRDDQGCALFDGERFGEIPGLLILSPVDTAGAGDSMLAGIGAALAAGATPLQAAEIGTVVAGVTAQKLMQTGTASPEEILSLGADADRRYRPDLAHDVRRARYAPGTEIEIVGEGRAPSEYTHVIFDHDGTISTLRQGWEAIMEPMMIRAILGNVEPDEALQEHVRAAVHDYIDKTTGIQTLVQMQGLASLVRRFRCVPEEEILDAQGYKRLYNEQLLAMVGARVERIRRGELSAADFTIRKSTEFLHALHERGALLYLASGTDQADVERESALLGCGKFFAGRIYGAVGDVTREAKRLVLERILRDIGPGAPGRTLTFGDGPVEIRETRKRGGCAVGVASDEVRRFGLNLLKRRRLVEAGADIIIPDFCQMEALLRLLFAC